MNKKQMSQALRQLREDDKPQFSRSLYACDEDLYKAKAEYYEQNLEVLRREVWAELNKLDSLTYSFDSRTRMKEIKTEILELLNKGS
jgi:hypothetical protein